MMKKFALLSFLFLFFGCATVPVTGRKQFSLISSSEINGMAATQYQEVIKKGPLSTNQEQVAMIKRVGSKIQKAIGQDCLRHANAAVFDFDPLPRCIRAQCYL